MTITVHCPRCKSGAKIGTKECRKCKHRFTPGNRKYRVALLECNPFVFYRVKNSPETPQIRSDLHTIYTPFKIPK